MVISFSILFYVLMDTAPRRSKKFLARYMRRGEKERCVSKKCDIGVNLPSCSSNPALSDGGISFRKERYVFAGHEGRVPRSLYFAQERCLQPALQMRFTQNRQSGNAAFPFSAPQMVILARYMVFWLDTWLAYLYGHPPCILPHAPALNISGHSCFGS